MLYLRGSVAARDAATGRKLWQTYTIAKAPRPTTKNSAGTQLWGPAWFPYGVSLMRDHLGSYRAALLVLFALALVANAAILALPRHRRNDGMI